jgi:cyanate permease
LHVPPTHFLYLIGIAASVFVVFNSLTFRPGPDRVAKDDPKNEVPVRDILAIPGVYAILLLSVVSNSAQELIVVYLPYLGPERGVSVNAVGLLLGIRAAFSVLSRLLYAPIIRRVGRHELMIGSTIAASVGFVVLALPLPVTVSAVAAAVIGFALGTSTTLSLTGMIDLVGAKGRGTGNTLRIMGNRIGQMAMPTLAGVLAAASGVGGVFVVLAINLAAAASMVHFGKKR